MFMYCRKINEVHARCLLRGPAGVPFDISEHLPGAANFVKYTWDAMLVTPIQKTELIEEFEKQRI